MRSVIDRKLEVERLYFDFRGDECKIGKFLELTNQMNVTKTFCCVKPFPAGFQHHFPRFPETINLWDSHWFQLNQLISCSCSVILLKNSNLKNQDIDLLLQKWKNNEALPNLLFLDIWTDNIDEHPPILGMTPPIHGNQNPERYISVKNGNREESLADPVRVIKDDGTVGFLKVELGFRPIVKLFVFDSSINVTEILRRRPIVEFDPEEESDDEEGAVDAN